MNENKRMDGMNVMATIAANELLKRETDELLRKEISKAMMPIPNYKPLTICNGITPLNTKPPVTKEDMLEITEYSYEEKTFFDKNNHGKETVKMVTTMAIKDCSGTRTVSVEAPKDKADQYTGFAIAYATLKSGGKKQFNKLVNYYINEKPKLEAKAIEKANKEKAIAEAEEKRIIEKHRKARIKALAKKRAEEYEAAKLANEKYGVPYDEEDDGGIW